MKSKPGTTPVTMMKSSYELFEIDPRCGCLMVQYGKEKGLKNLSCSYSEIMDMDDPAYFSNNSELSVRFQFAENKTEKFIRKCFAAHVETFQAALELEKTIDYQE